METGTKLRFKFPFFSSHHDGQHHHNPTHSSIGNASETHHEEQQEATAPPLQPQQLQKEQHPSQPSRPQGEQHLSQPPGEQHPPAEFLCPISGQLMADPIILSTGQSFERGCIKACIDLGIDPPPPQSSSSQSFSHQLAPLCPSTYLIPNVGLRSTILSWCDKHDHDRPKPIDPAVAAHLVRTKLVPTTQIIPRSTDQNTDPVSISTDPCDVEEEIVQKLKSSEISDQEQGLVHLRAATRGSGYQGSELCTQKLLSCLCPFLHSRHPNLQSNATAAVVNLSLDPKNKRPIVSCGAVPPLVSALESFHAEIRSHAAAAVFSLAVENSNKATIGALAALPPLLRLLSRPAEDVNTRRDAALALHHLSNGCSSNLTRLIKLGAARTLLDVVREQEFGVLGGVGLMVVGNLAGCVEGKAALMDAGTVEVLADVLKRLRSGQAGNEKNPARKGRRELCVHVLYKMSKGSLRFRGLARAARLVEILEDVSSEEEEGMADLARRTLQEMKGEAVVGEFGVAEGGGSVGGEVKSMVLEKKSAALSRWPQPRGRTGDGVNANTTKF